MPLVSYAGYQNAVPILRSLTIRNNRSEILDDLMLVMESRPPIIRPKRWQIPRILPHRAHQPADRRLDPDPAYLSGLDEGERGELLFRLMQGQ